MYNPTHYVRLADGKYLWHCTTTGSPMGVTLEEKPEAFQLETAVWHAGTSIPGGLVAVVNVENTHMVHPLGHAPAYSPPLTDWIKKKADWIRKREAVWGKEAGAPGGACFMSWAELLCNLAALGITISFLFYGLWQILLSMHHALNRWGF